ncbi:hypothetical protein GGR56DRAFT_621546 [Xylariaceae sp. FL0804]|nr:hypothetical protein GGR56DRAFT_621546 [Xylariaceae sp. FL0804]
MSDDATAQSVAQPVETAPVPGAASAAGATAAAAEGAVANDAVAPVADTEPTDSKSASVAAVAMVKPDEEQKSKPAEKEPATTEDTKPASTTDAAPVASTSTDQNLPETDVDMKDAPTEEAAADSGPSTETKPQNPPETMAAVEQNGASTSAGEATGELEGATPRADKKRRKSAGFADKGKKLNKKASKAKILHTDAQPGDHFFAKLKGFPPWPVVICEEGMLPPELQNSRPVTAARPDGTYRDDFADGGKSVALRTFPVMYLHTNEFSWMPNTDLTDLDPATVVGLITSKMRKDLQNAHVLAAEQNNLDYYKNVLQEFAEQRQAKLDAKAAKDAAKVKTPKKASKAADAAATDEDGDLDMADVDGEIVETVEKKTKSKKRKAEDDTNTPQRSDSVKKPKIKLTNSSTPKTTNGLPSPTPAKDSAKPIKVKGKAAKGTKEAASKSERESLAPKEPELTPQERATRKEKEILFLRHRLQKGLLPREHAPKEEEMKPMSEFLAKLETFPDLEVSIIRATKINKVLKAILKIEAIPKEADFQFKSRSQVLLDKWNHILATANDGAASAPAAANGVNGTSGSPGKAENTANGVSEKASEVEAKPEKDVEKADDTKDETETKAAAPSIEEKPAATEVSL